MSKKKLDQYDLSLSGHKPIKPRTNSQSQYLKALASHDVVFGLGPAGTGKTFIAASYAIEALATGQTDRVIITRATVPIADEQIGFLPGSLEKKMEPWTAEIFDVFRERIGQARVVDLMKQGMIQIIPFAFMRGRTFKNALIIADEMQNSRPSQAKALVTRIGENTRMFINGDLNQTDIRGENGLQYLVDAVDQKALPFPMVRFTAREVVRSETCKIWVEALSD